MVTHLIYHGNCYDGFGAAWACWKKYPNAQFIPAKYGDDPPALPKDADVVIADFSYPRPTMEKMQRDVAAWACLDHHKTAQAACEGLTGCIFDMDHSGAYLSWRYFHPDAAVPKFIQYIEDRDLWRFALPDSREVSACLQSYAYDFAIWSEFADEMERGLSSIVSEGKAILRAKRRMVEQMADAVRWREIGGHHVPVANASCYFSEVGEQLCINHPEAPFSAYYFDRGDGKRQWGLRSRSGFDVSAVAKAQGGGGHPAAAGFVEART